MQSLWRVVYLCPCALALGCFEVPPNSTPGDDEVGTEETDTGETSTTDTTTDTSDTTTGAENQPPVVDDFTANGSASPGPVDAASAVALLASASDPDGNLDHVEIALDGALLVTLDGAGPDFQTEWLVSGAELNGDYALTATAFDAEGLASDPVELSVTLAMPDGGGEVDAWSYDGGLLDSLTDIAVSPEGEQVLLAGQTSVMQQSRQRVDRVVGDTWTDKVSLESASAGGAVWVDDHFVVSGSVLDPNFIDSGVRIYDASGVEVESWTFKANKPEMGDPEVVETAAGLELGADGRFYIFGRYNPTSGPLMGMLASYVLVVTSAGDQEWVRWPTEDPNITGTPLLTELAVSPEGEIAAVGYTNATPHELWLGRWDADGQLLNEYSLADGDASEGHALAYADAGSLIVAGGMDMGEMHSWVRKLNADDEEVWTIEPNQAGKGMTAAVAVDPWGEIITVSTEGCDDSFLLCEVVVRKYAADGSPMWTQVFSDDLFAGPVANLPGADASVEIDRFGYIYVTAVSGTGDTGTDWWARKLHP